MSLVDQSTSVGRYVAGHPQTARVFEELEIDYCCGGGQTLHQACTDHRISVDDLIARLEQADANCPAQSGQDWTQVSATALCDHIEQTHHAFLRRELPRLSGLIDKVARAHGERDPEVLELRTVFGELRAELEPHMFKEERVLFPAIRQLDQPGRHPSFPFGTVANPIRVMEHEHDAAGSALQRIRQLTHDFQAPTDACRTWQVMLEGLQALERDMHQHVHKENNILFPNAQRLEASGDSH